MELTSIQLRILNKIKEMNVLGVKPFIELISKDLIDFQLETKTKNEIDILIKKGIILKNEEELFLDEKFNEYNWLNYLISKNQSRVIVLGMPGNHTIKFVMNLDEKDVLYIDHSVAWRSLINNAKKNLFIVSPFADQAGFKIFGPNLIKALLRGVSLEIITRDLSPYAKNSGRRKAFSRFITHLKDEKFDPNISIFQVHDGVSNDELAVHLGSVHAKMLIQDNENTYIGSGEFRGNSIFKNVEIGYVFSNKNDVIDFKKIFEATKSIALPVNWRDLL